ncbi:MAG: BREX-1 system adenine-specific DNA-methyltransferase PglX [Chromatiales bacterium]|nr:Eco57I restriction-modification methylase domain-containing protein [Gammaproteobacteria bacterium]
MDKRLAQQTITDLFDNPFDRERYQHFLNNLLNRYEPRNGHYTGNYIPDAYKQHIKQYWRIGKYQDPEGDELDLLVVQVKSLSKLERARSALRNFAVTRLKQFEKEASLIAFYAEDDQGADWRFSFIKIEHEAYQDDIASAIHGSRDISPSLDKKGKVKLRQKLTPAKRYSYLVGVHENSHTASKQLLPLLEMDYADPRIEEIEAAFSIEKVTGEFFEQYKALFQNLAEHLKSQPLFSKSDEEARDQQVSRFAKKLLGQVVFLYFLQKKGWLGVDKDKPWGTGSKRFMRDRFDQVLKEGGDYYHDFLQYLFYEALADERKGQEDPGYYTRFDCRVPFLNGGLFEPDYDWQKEHIDLPNSLFHNTEKNKNGDVGTGILNVFDRYNFTIKEDEPLEKEVAVDPEMLGKVFENMLEVTERKSKGAFYTPREIVHYMCQESLIHYLDNRLNSYASTPELAEPQAELFGSPGGQQSLEDVEEIKAPKADLETLIRKGHLFIENDQAALLALERIEKGEQKQTKKEIALPESVRQHAKAIDEALADIKVCDPAIGSGAFPVGLLHEIVNARLALAPHSGNSQSAYELKRHAIAESIYGVDIDASAIDIARLRLWLSLIVDEEDYDTIEALPNLDYKIVRGDSLVGIDGIGKVDDIFNPKFTLISELENEKQNFFSTTNHNTKIDLSKKITDLIHQITNGKEAFDFKIYFSEVWHQKGGFDVVIGNPPYVSHDRISKDNKEVYKAVFDSYEPFADIYCYFIEKSIFLLNSDGVVSLITSNSYLRAKYGAPLRKTISNNCSIVNLINVDDYQLFRTAIVNTAIIVAQLRELLRPAIVASGTIEPSLDFINFVKLTGFSCQQRLFGEKPWRLISRDLIELLAEIENGNVTLEDLNTKIRLGLATGNNEAFVIDQSKREALIKADPKSAEIIKPVLRGRDIQRYYYKPPEKYILLTRNEIDVKREYSAIFRYLDSLGERFKNRGARGKNWTNLRACSFFDDFREPKIIWIELSDTGRFALCEEEIYLLNSAYFLIPPPRIIPRYLLSILNSSVIHFYLIHTAETSGMGTSRWFNIHVREFPIHIARNDIQQIIGCVVDYCSLSTLKELKLYAAYFDQLIDGLVYELYFHDEIKAANKEILPHLGELSPITDGMTEEEKLATIRREFDRLYDPRHPVRNNLETLDSVAVVRTIREALKR